MTKSTQNSTSFSEAVSGDRPDGTVVCRPPIVLSMAGVTLLNRANRCGSKPRLRMDTVDDTDSNSLCKESIKRIISFNNCEGAWFSRVRNWIAWLHKDDSAPK